MNPKKKKKNVPLEDHLHNSESIKLELGLQSCNKEDKTCQSLSSTPVSCLVKERCKEPCENALITSKSGSIEILNKLENKLRQAHLKIKAGK